MALKGLKEAVAEIKAQKGKGKSEEAEEEEAEEEEASAKATEKKPEKPEKSERAGALPLGLSIKKLALLIALLIASAVSSWFFSLLDLHVMDFISPFALPTLAAKLLSFNSIAFLVLLSLAISLASLYGYRSSFFGSILAFATIIPALGMALFLKPSLLFVFLAVAVSVSVVSILASRKESLGLGTSWNLAGKAMLLLMLFAFLIVLAKAQADKDAFVRGMAGAAASAVPQLQQQVAPVVAGLVKTLPIDENTVRSLVTKEAVEGMLASQYDAFADSVQNYLPPELAQAMQALGLNFSLPKFASLPEEQRAALVEKARDAFVTRLSAELPRLKEQIGQKAEEALKQPLVQLDAEQVEKAIAAAKQASPLVAMFLDLIGVFAALGVVAVVWIAGWPVKIFSMLLTWIPAKLLF